MLEAASPMPGIPSLPSPTQLSFASETTMSGQVSHSPLPHLHLNPSSDLSGNMKD